MVNDSKMKAADECVCVCVKPEENGMLYTVPPKIIQTEQWPQRLPCQMLGFSSTSANHTQTLMCKHTKRHTGRRETTQKRSRPTCTYMDKNSFSHTHAPRGAEKHTPALGKLTLRLTSHYLTTMWDVAEAEQNHCQSGSNLNTKPHLPLWPSWETCGQNTHALTNIQNTHPDVQVIQSILHFLHIDGDKMDRKRHDANSRERALTERRRDFPYASHATRDGMREVDEEEGVVLGVWYPSRSFQGGGGWPPSTLTFIQLHPGSQITGKPKVGGPRAKRSQAGEFPE